MQQSAFDYLRHGQMPFFRLPLATLARRDAGAYAGADAVLLGIPFDGGTTYQPGARLAPFHVRRVSALVQSYHPDLRVDVFGELAVVDGGNVAFPPFDPGAMRDLAQQEVMRILEAGAAPFVVGGDHSVALPALRAVAARHGALAVIHLDAHLDTSGPHTWGHEHHHGTPLRHAITERLVAPGQLYQVGIRAPWGSAEDGDLGASHGALRYPVCALHALGIDAVAREITTRIGSRPTYLTVDVDVVDPAFAPGTGTPVPGGLSSHELLAFLGQLAGLNLVGMDLVEVCPPLDHADITSHLAASTLFTGLALLAAARHRGGR